MEHSRNKILIVDDDQFILDMYALKLKEHGFAAEIARDGKEALKKFKELGPDLVMLDVVLPAMDGFDILKEIKRDKSAAGVKVVLLTNLGQKEDVERGLKLGADDYIIKANFTPSEVVKKVKDLLEK